MDALKWSMRGWNIGGGIMNRLMFINHYLLALLLFNLAACSSLQSVSVESAMKNSPPSGVDYGSLVEVKTLDRQTVKFRVTRYNAEGLGGTEKFYRYSDMASLKVERPESKNKESDTVSIILGVLGIAALVFLVANADSVAVCAPSPCEHPPR
jgi:hypothetical protein